MEALASCEVAASDENNREEAVDIDDAENSRSSACTLDDAIHAMRARRKTRRVIVEIAVERTDGGEASAQGADTRKTQQRPSSAPQSRSKPPRHFAAQVHRAEQMPHRLPTRPAAAKAALEAAAAAAKPFQLPRFRIALQCSADVTWKRLALAAAQRFRDSTSNSSNSQQADMGSSASGSQYLPINVSCAGPGWQDDFLHPDALALVGDYALSKMRTSSRKTNKPAANDHLNQGSIIPGGVHFSTAGDASPTGSAPATAGVPRATWQESAQAVFEGTYNLPATSDYHYHGMSFATAVMASSAFGFSHRHKNGDRRSDAHRYGHMHDINSDDVNVDVWVTLAARVSLNRSCAVLPRWYTIAFALSAASTERRQTALALEIQHQAESRARADVLEGFKSKRPAAVGAVATAAMGEATGTKRAVATSSSQHKRALVEVQTLLDRFLQRDQYTSIPEAHSVVSAATWMIAVPSEREAVATTLLSFLPQLVVLFRAFTKSKDGDKRDRASKKEGTEETNAAANSAGTAEAVSADRPVVTNIPGTWLALPPIAMDFSAFQHFASRCRLSAENKHLSAAQLQRQQQQVVACFQRSNVLNERWSPCVAFQQQAAARDAKREVAAHLSELMKPRAARHISVEQHAPTTGAGAATAAESDANATDGDGDQGDNPEEQGKKKEKNEKETGEKYGLNGCGGADFAGMSARANAEFMQQVIRENTLRSNAKRFHLQHNTYHMKSTVPSGPAVSASAADDATHDHNLGYVSDPASSSSTSLNTPDARLASNSTRTGPGKARTEVEKEEEVAKSVLTGYEQQPERRLFDNRPLRSTECGEGMSLPEFLWVVWNLAKVKYLSEDGKLTGMGDLPLSAHQDEEAQELDKGEGLELASVDDKGEDAKDTWAAELPSSHPQALNYHCGLPRCAPHRHHFQAPPHHLRLHKSRKAPTTTKTSSLSSSSSKPPLKKKQGKGGVAQKTGVSGSGAANGATKLGGVTPGASGAASAATITAPPHHPKPRDPITNHACFFGVGAATNRFFADVLLPLAVHDRKRLEQMVVFAFHTEDVQRIVSGYLRPLQAVFDQFSSWDSLPENVAKAEAKRAFAAEQLAARVAAAEQKQLAAGRKRWARKDLKEEAEAVARELAAKEEAAKAEAKADNDHATMSLGEFVAVTATSRVAASATARRAFFTSQVAEQVYEPIIRVSTRKPQVPPAPHSNKNHTTKNNNESATDAAATDSGSHHSSSSIHGGKGAGVEASMSLASVSYALVDLHASYATETTAQLFEVTGDKEDDPFKILNNASGGGGADSKGHDANNAKDDELEVMDFGEFVAALVRIGVWKVLGSHDKPITEQVDRVLAAVAAIEDQPRSSATMEASRRKQHAKGK